MIMRFVDGASEPFEMNRQLVVTYKVSFLLRSRLPAKKCSFHVSSSWASAKESFAKSITSLVVQAGKNGYLPNLAEGWKTSYTYTKSAMLMC